MKSSDFLPPLPPSDTDIENGFTVRKFVKTGGTVIEVRSLGKFSGMEDVETFEIKWRIQGPDFDVHNDSGARIESGVIDTNRRVLERTPEVREAALPLDKYRA